MEKIRANSFWLGILVLTLEISFSVRGQGFHPDCTLPFDDIKEEHAIDGDCGLEGNPASPANHRAQNRAKNNFCASNGPVNVTFFTFRQLERKAEDEGVPFGGRLPEDRSVLVDLHTTTDGKKIGEGTHVRLVAFVAEAHASNVSGGESVNCKKKTAENNDIHVVLVKDPEEDDFCNSLTAEISPHFRPSAWEEITHRRFGTRPLRLTGQLFFDASHKPCTDTTRHSPARFSVWEIHPVYAMDVCKKKSLTNCKVDRESDWIPFHEWVGVDAAEEDNDH